MTLKQVTPGPPKKTNPREGRKGFIELHPKAGHLAALEPTSDRGEKKGRRSSVRVNGFALGTCRGKRALFTEGTYSRDQKKGAAREGGTIPQGRDRTLPNESWSARGSLLHSEEGRSILNNKKMAETPNTQFSQKKKNTI